MYSIYEEYKNTQAMSFVHHVSHGACMCSVHKDILLNCGTGIIIIMILTIQLEVN